MEAGYPGDRGGEGRGEGRGQAKGTQAWTVHTTVPQQAQMTQMCAYIHNTHTAAGLRWLPPRDAKANFFVEWRLKFGICYERALSNKTQAPEYIGR